MTPEDVVRLASTLRALGATFNEPVSDLRAESYLFALEEFSIEQVEDAAKHAIKTCKFFPRPAELREFIAGTEDMQAEMAWHELHSEFRRVGSWRPPTLSRTTFATMEQLCGTWERACALIGRAESPAELQGWQKRWKEAYGQTQGRIQRGELIGRAEAREILAALQPKQLPDADQGDLPAVSSGVSDSGDVPSEKRAGDGRQLLRVLR